MLGYGAGVERFSAFRARSAVRERGREQEKKVMWEKGCLSGLLIARKPLKN